MAEVRGSERLLAAWKSRGLTDDSVGEIASAFDESPGVLTDIALHGGAAPVGLTTTVTYSGDDVDWCGNDIRFWLKWHLQHGGAPRPPRIIINGTPFPELIRLQLDFGWAEQVPVDIGMVREQGRLQL